MEDGRREACTTSVKSVGVPAHARLVTHLPRAPPHCCNNHASSAALLATDELLIIVSVAGPPTIGSE